jgi:hypothetical protein
MIYQSNSNQITYQTEPKVTFVDWYGMHPYRIDATFDFSKIPKELHQPFLTRLVNEYNSNRRTILENQSTEGWLGKILNYKIF